jgi:prephenate dehydrogenase
MIICPLPRTKPESVALMRDLAAYIGASRAIVSPIEKHDEIIAYTSELMHISAVALCMDFHPDMTLAFTAGAFRDCTRVADINAPAWTELLLSNAANTTAALERYIGRLTELRDAIKGKDADRLTDLLELGGVNKREMLGR